MNKSTVVMLLGLFVGSLLVFGIWRHYSPENQFKNPKFICIDQVEYINARSIYGSSITAHVKPDGSVYGCK